MSVANVEELDTLLAAVLHHENAAGDLAATQLKAKLKRLGIHRNIFAPQASEDWITEVFSKVGHDLSWDAVKKYETKCFEAEAELHRLKELYKEKE